MATNLASKEQILSLIEKQDNFAIVISHPDEDSVGAGLTLEEILDQKHKRVKLFTHLPVRIFNYLPNIAKYQLKDITKIDFSQFAAVFVLDADKAERTVGYFEKVEFKSTVVVNIDHHITNTYWGSVNYVISDPYATSTTEILFNLFKDHSKITPSIATNILAGILGDTNCFKNMNVSASVFNTVHELFGFKADYHYLIQKLYHSKSLDYIRKNIEILGKIQIAEVNDIKFAHVLVDNKLFGGEVPERQEIALTYETLRSVGEIDFFVLIEPISKNSTKLSFRGENVDVSQIAKLLGGGGHRESAAAEVKMPAEEAIAKVKQILEKEEVRC